MTGVTSGVDSPRPKFYRKDNTAQLNTAAGESQSDTSLTRDVNPQYAKFYLQRVLNSDNLPEPPNKEMCNGFYQPLYDLYKAHESGGLRTVYDIWERVTKPNNPKLAALIGQHPALKEKRWTFTPAADLFDLPPVKYLYSHYLIEEGLNILYGPSGIGKSFVALDWALNIAQDHDVLYLARESQRGYADRIKSWCNHHQKTVGKLRMPKEQLDLMDNAAVDIFILEVQVNQIKPVLLVFDTLARSMSGDENRAEDINRVTANCERIQKELGAAILLIHHTGKSASAGARGSSAIFANADCVTRLDDVDGAVRLTCEKAKEDEKFEPEYIKFIHIAARDERTSLVPIPSEKSYDDPDDISITSNQRAVLDILALAVYSQEDIRGAKMGARYSELKTELPNINLPRTLSQLQKKGMVERPTNKRDPWSITTIGYEALDMKETGTGKPISLTERATSGALRKRQHTEAMKKGVSANV